MTGLPAATLIVLAMLIGACSHSETTRTTSEPQTSTTTARTADQTTIATATTTTISTTTTAALPTTVARTGCAVTRLSVLCPLHDGQSISIEATGLPPLTTIAFGLCAAAPNPTPDDCTPGTANVDNRSAVVDPAGTVRVGLIAERHLLLPGHGVDCAITECELRALINDRQSGATITTIRDRVQFADPPTLTVDIGDPFSLSHRVDHPLQIRSAAIDLGHATIQLEQCTLGRVKLTFGVAFPSCVRIPTRDVQLTSDTATLQFSPSRWTFADSPVDCALAARSCWISVLIGGNVATRISVVVSGAAPVPTLTATPHDALRDRTALTISLNAMPPRQWSGLIYCLDTERTRQAPSAQGDGADGCTSLDADLSPLGTDQHTAWPPDQITITAVVPRILRWADTDYDCADARGCRIVYLSGSDTYADYAQDITVHFAP